MLHLHWQPAKLFCQSLSKLLPMFFCSRASLHWRLRLLCRYNDHQKGKMCLSFLSSSREKNPAPSNRRLQTIYCCISPLDGWSKLYLKHPLRGVWCWTSLPVSMTTEESRVFQAKRSLKQVLGYIAVPNLLDSMDQQAALFLVLQHLDSLRLSQLLPSSSHTWRWSTTQARFSHLDSRKVSQSLLSLEQRVWNHSVCMPLQYSLAPV